MKMLAEKKVQSVDKDSDGIWVYLNWGRCLDFPNSGGHLVHEDTQEACLMALGNTFPCNCKECTSALAKANQAPAPAPAAPAVAHCVSCMCEVPAGTRACPECAKTTAALKDEVFELHADIQNQKSVSACLRDELAVTQAKNVELLAALEDIDAGIKKHLAPGSLSTFMTLVNFLSAQSKIIRATITKGGK